MAPQIWANLNAQCMLANSTDRPIIGGEIVRVKSTQIRNTKTEFRRDQKILLIARPERAGFNSEKRAVGINFRAEAKSRCGSLLALKGREACQYGIDAQADKATRLAVGNISCKANVIAKASLDTKACP